MDAQTRFVFPAGVTPLDEPRTSHLRERLQERAADPSIFKEHPPVFFTARISTSAIDSYFTQMMPSTLKNFAREAQEGLSFQDSHRRDQLGIGRSLDGRYVETANGAHVEADIFTLGGLPELDGFIHRLRAGIASDISIGFAGGRHNCSVCSADLWKDRGCQHIPGLEYEVRGPGGDSQRKLAVAYIEDAHATEVSAVFDAATPGCSIVKARLEAERGRMSPEVARVLSERYRSLDLPFITDILRASPIIIAPERKVDAMPDPKEAKETKEPEADETTEILPVPDLPPPEDDEDDVLTEPDDTTRMVDEALAAADISYGGSRYSRREGVRELVELAREGRQHRAQMIDEALDEGIRVFGQSFKIDTYRALFRSASPETIQAIRKEWLQRAQEKFPGGRQTVETTQEKRSSLDLPSDIWG
jgi:hypothetical protein